MIINEKNIIDFIELIEKDENFLNPIIDFGERMKTEDKQNKIMGKKMWFLYILLCRQDKYYVGIAYNPEKRIQQHCYQKHGAQFTKIYHPIKILKKINLNTTLLFKAETIEQTMAHELVKNIGVGNGGGGGYGGLDDCLEKDKKFHNDYMYKKYNPDGIKKEKQRIENNIKFLKIHFS